MSTLTFDRPIFDFQVARSLILNFQARPDTLLERMAYSILFDDADSLKTRRASHLTHSVSQKNQIRFALFERIESSLRPLAQKLAQAIEISTTATITLPLQLMLGDQLFIALVAEYLSDPSIRFEQSSQASSHSEALGPNEKSLLRLLEKASQCCDSREAALKISNSLIYSGNYWTARNALELLHTFDPIYPEINYSLGLISNFFKAPEKAEEYFEMARLSGDALVQIKSSYTLAMLYSRHHSTSRINTDISARYLENARNIIAEAEIEDRDFQYVFNRNGYALILFRHGKIEEAIQWLEFGIGKLKESCDEAIHLHVSVLQYNLCQCFQASGRLTEAHKAFKDLIEIDPLFAEYRIDWGLLFCKSGAWNEALREFQMARELNPYLSEAYQNIAYVYTRLGQSGLAQSALEEGLKHLPSDDDLLAQALWLNEQSEKGA